MAYDAFLQLKDIPGESTASGFEMAIELLGMSWSAHTQATVGAGRGGLTTSRVSVSAFTITKQTDSSSPRLFHACCVGTHIATAKVSYRKQTGDGQEAFLIYDFTDVVVESINFGGARAIEDVPMETANFVFGRVQMEYKTQGADGKLTSGTPVVWDLTTLSAK